MIKLARDESCGDMDWAVWTRTESSAPISVPSAIFPTRPFTTPRGWLISATDWLTQSNQDRPHHDWQEVEDKLERLKDALEKQVWHDQASSTGFRKVKSCTAGPYCHPKDTRRTVLWMAEAIINERFMISKRPSTVWTGMSSGSFCITMITMEFHQSS